MTVKCRFLISSRFLVHTGICSQSIRPVPYLKQSSVVAVISCVMFQNPFSSRCAVELLTSGIFIIPLNVPTCCVHYTPEGIARNERERERESIFFLKREKIDCLKQATSNVMATCIFSSMNTIGKYRKYREIEGGNKNTVSHDYFSILVNILVYITVFLYPCINRYH